MPRYSYSQNNFISGEISPKLRGRSDIQQYFQSLAKLRNFIPYRTGGVASRPGTKFLADITLTPPLATSAYSLRLDTDDDGDFLFYPSVTSGGITGFQIIRNITTNNTEVVAVTIAVEIAGIDPGAVLPPTKANYTQIGNLLVIVDSDGNLEPTVLRKLANGTFTLKKYSTEVGEANQTNAATPLNSAQAKLRGVPFRVRNVNTSNQITLSGSGTAISFPLDTLVAGDVRSYIRISDGTVENVYQITTVTNSKTAVVADVLGVTFADATHVGYALSSWTNGNFPRTVTLFQERLVFGGNKTGETDTVWLSAIGNIFLMLNFKLKQDSSSDGSKLNYFGSISTADSFSVLLYSQRLNTCRWMVSDKNIQVGTEFAEHIIAPVDGILGPTNVQVTTQTFFGGTAAQAARFHNATYYVGQGGEQVRELSFSEENGSNVSRLLTGLADHLVREEETTVGAKSVFNNIEIQKSNSTLWLTTTVAKLLIGITVERATGILAWHAHDFQDAEIFSVSAATNQDDERDNCYLMLKRVVDGADLYTLEYFSLPYDGDGIPSANALGTGFNEDLTMTDSTIYPTSVTSNEVDVPHLVGEDVDVLVKGIYEGRQTVSASGKITIADTSADGSDNEIAIGLPYTSILETMPIEPGSPLGNSQALTNRISQVVIKLYKSKSGYFVSNGNGAIEDIDYSRIGALDLFTGFKKIAIDATPDEEQVIRIERNKPFPLNVLSLGMKGEMQDN